MAVLSNGDRTLVETAVNRDVAVIQGIAITKPDLRAAINAIDDWVDSNSSAFNTAIPQPARGGMTTKQKAALLLYVVNQRYLVA